MAKHVLIVATSNSKLGDTGKSTGCWAEEIMAPLMLFKAKGYDVTVASMKGGKIPIDEGSMSDQFKTDEVKAFCDREEYSAERKKIEESVPLASITTPDTYDAIFVPGGHGVCWDMPDSRELQGLLGRAFESGKVVSSVCHGPICLANVLLSDGSHLVKGKNVTGFSDSEEKGVGLAEVVPRSLEQALKDAGGKYSAGDDWAPYVQKEGNLITGQNPGSSVAVAEEIIKVLGQASAGPEIASGSVTGKQFSGDGRRS
eukprot:TRINITY_DN24130_c1_g1_i1.p1 TRINITY_DN24130_c1_g1~~TRINITY_DN24130_c1_g1_i1.p1  ORF type:complete len:285 (-),score=43.72 TRINITY_DN24130_c1_g1_i1:212-982(-)